MMQWLMLLAFFTTSTSGARSSPYVDDAKNDNSENAINKPYVILISVDGYHPDNTERFQAPNFSKMQLTWAQAYYLLPVFPSKTFTNHWSMITGLYPENHGVMGNTFYDPELKAAFKHSDPKTAEDGKWYGGEPLWVATERQGMLAASFFWPGSSAEIGGIRPSYYYHYSLDTTHQERVERLTEWLSLPAKRRPHFISFYFADVDRSGHLYGPYSPETRNAVIEVDKTIGQLIAVSEKSGLPINFIVLSDHGMQAVPPNQIEYLDDYTDLSEAKVLGSGSQVLIYCKSKDQTEKIYRDLQQKKKHFKVYKRDELPPHWHFSKNPRAGDLIVNTDAPYEVALRNPPEPSEKGSHGYDPDTTETMRAVFFAKGPKIKPGIKIPPFRNIHIYPWIMSLLELKNDPTNHPIDGEISPLKPLLLP